MWARVSRRCSGESMTKDIEEIIHQIEDLNNTNPHLVADLSEIWGFTSIGVEGDLPGRPRVWLEARYGEPEVIIWYRGWASMDLTVARHLRTFRNKTQLRHYVAKLAAKEQGEQLQKNRKKAHGISHDEKRRRRGMELWEKHWSRGGE